MANIVTFDGTTKIITEISVAGDNVLDVLEVYSEWKEWVKLSDNMKFLQAFTPVGGDPISDVQDLGITYFLENGWRIRPAELSHKLTLIGNIFTRESGQSVFIPTIGAFTVNTETRVSNLTDSSVARLDLTQLLQAVYIDTINGTSGTGLSIGTPTKPVSNITDARTIANRDGLRAYVIRGAITLDADYRDWYFRSAASELAAAVNLGTQNVDNAKFEDISLSGAMQPGEINATSCTINILTEIAGVFRSCGLQNNFTIQSGGIAIFADCYSEVAGTATPICNVNGAATVNFRNYSGGIALQNVTAGNLVSVDLDPGHLILEASCTGGDCLVRGTGKLTDNSVGTNVISDGLVQPGVTEFPVSDADKQDIVNRVFTRMIETGVNFEEAMRLVLTEAAGSIIKSGDLHEIRNVGDTKTRIFSTANENGRTVTSTDVT